jgi:hypothetical protein
MGYDLHLIRSSDSPRQPYVLSITMFAMSEWRGLMGELGMLARDYERHYVPYEAAYDSYVSRVGHRPESECEFLNSGEGTAASVWRPPLAGAPSETAQPGIAMHKLCSNDMWWVTAAECREALAAWRAAVAHSLPAEACASRDDERRLVTGAVRRRGDIDDEALRIMNRCCDALGRDEGPCSVAEIEQSLGWWFTFLEFLEVAADEQGFEVW